MIRVEFDLLDKFYRECVRFWENRLNTDSDLSKEPCIKALEDVMEITTNPYIAFNSPLLDLETKEYFIKRCEMDIGLNKDFARMQWKN